MVRAIHVVIEVFPLSNEREQINYPLPSWERQTNCCLFARHFLLPSRFHISYPTYIGFEKKIVFNPKLEEPVFKHSRGDEINPS